MKETPDQDDKLLSAIISGAEKDRLKPHSLFGDIATMFGFCRKGEKEKAVDALTKYEIANGTRSRLESIIGLFTLGDDTLIVENQIKKVVRWTPRVVLGGILVFCLAYDPNVRGSVTKTFHTFKTNVTKTIEGFIKKQ